MLNILKNGENMENKNRIKLFMTALALTSLVMVLIYTCILNAASDYNIRLLERWLGDARKINDGMTYDEVVFILGKPSSEFLPNDKSELSNMSEILELFYNAPDIKQKQTDELIPDRFMITLTNGVVSEKGMWYK